MDVETTGLERLNGSHFLQIHSSLLKLRGGQPNGNHLCQIEMSSLSSMTTPECCGV